MRRSLVARPGLQDGPASERHPNSLVDVDSGQQYVGSAKGAESLRGRWMDYAAGGDGGDVALKAAASDGPKNYQVSVLEVVDESTPDETIEQIDSYWKSKLLSRMFGLNRN